MKKILCVVATPPAIPDLSGSLRPDTVEVEEIAFAELGFLREGYDLVILLGLTGVRLTGLEMVRDIRVAIGEGVPFLVVASWNPEDMASFVRQVGNAEYFYRLGVEVGGRAAFVAKIRQMLKLKTAPSA